jgi:hypothetical protein
MANSENCTVRELMDALKDRDPEDLVEIVLEQRNKQYPVAYLPIQKQNMYGANSLATSYTSGVTRIYCNLPQDEKTFMYTGTKRIR